MLGRLLLLCLTTVKSLEIRSGEVGELVWTSQAESDLLTEDQHKVAFRDVVIEKALQRMFDVYLHSSKVGKNNTNFPRHLLIEDPTRLTTHVDFKKKQPGLLDIQFKAWNLLLHGLHNIQLKNLHVLRHIGLRDIRVVIQVVADLHVTGDYRMEGTGLSMIPVTGGGALEVKVQQLMLTGETFLVLREPAEGHGHSLHVKDLDLKMSNKDLTVKLEHLLGGGLAGTVANDILSTIGEDLLYQHKVISYV